MNIVISPQDFIVKRKVGKGSFGRVFLVEYKKDNKDYAMKVLEKTHIKESDLVENSKVERIILSQVHFPFIVELFYSFQTSKRLYLVTEYISGGDLSRLFSKPNKIGFQQIRLYLAEIIITLDYLHKKNCIYRDLKPENILLNHDGHIKIIDFGLSKMFFGLTNNRADSICGTAEYMAPEIIYDSTYNHTVDWFSLGAITFYFFTGYTAFNLKGNAMNHTIKRKPIYYNSKIFDKESQDFVKGLLNYDPKKRLGAKSVDELKGHPFFSGLDWKKVINKEYIPTYIPEIKNVNDNFILDDSIIKNGEGEHEKIDSPPVIQKSKKNPTYEGFTYMKETELQLVKMRNDIEDN